MMTANSAVQPSVWTDDIQNAPFISVLLPAWNEARMIERCLDSLLELDWPGLEIILCAGGSDQTLAIAHRYESERVIVLEQRAGEGKQRALRRCFERSRGEIIYLTDADCIVPNSTFGAVIAPVRMGFAEATTGTSRPMDEQIGLSFPFFQWSILRAVERHRPTESSGLLGRNCAVRRDALETAGAFAESVPIGTDYHLAKCLLQTGARIQFIPDAVETAFPERIGEFLQQQSRWLRNIFLHGRRFGDRAELIACGRTVILGTGFVIFPLTWWRTKRPGVVLWLVALLGLSMLRYRYSRALAVEIARPLSRAYVLQLPVLTLIDITSWMWPFIDMMTKGKKRW